jgi:hypothetical protein
MRGTASRDARPPNATAQRSRDLQNAPRVNVNSRPRGDANPGGSTAAQPASPQQRRAPAGQEPSRDGQPQDGDNRARRQTAHPSGSQAGSSQPRVIRVEDRAKLMQHILRQRNGRAMVRPPANQSQEPRNTRVQPQQGPRKPPARTNVSRPAPSQGKATKPRSSQKRSGSRPEKKKNR